MSRIELHLPMPAQTVLAAAFALVLAGGARAADDVPAALYHPFDLAPAGAWAETSVPLDPAEWRVGSVDGPRATAGQLRATLAALARVSIGGRCASVVEGDTSYRCGFALEALVVDGIDAGRFEGIALGAPTLTFEPLPVVAEVAMTAGATPDDPERMEPLQLVAGVSGDDSDAGALPGGHIAFRLRSVSNMLRPSSFDAASGVIELRAGPRRSRHDAKPGRVSI